MNYFKKTLVALMVAAFVFVPVAHAQTYTYSTNTRADLQAQLQLLIQQVLRLQEQLRARGVYTPSYNFNEYRSDCFSGYYYRDGRCYYDRYDDDADDIDEIEVEYVGRIAQVRVEYDDGDVERFAFHADTDREVAILLSRELGISAATLEDIIDEVDRDRDHDDIDDIDVYFEDDDADVIVRFEDGDRDRFTLRNVDRDKDDVIEELADRYDEDEDDIEDLVDWHYRDHDDDDIDEIDVRFFGDDADVTVYFEDGDEDRFTLRDVDEDEDEVIEYLADRYDMDEDDIEDVIDFRDGDDNDEDIRDIDVEFDNDDAFITVRFDDGDTTHITLRNVDEDEDEVIEYLADYYDMDEDDIEDLIDFEYN